jgi:hypothetical protein
VGSVLPTFPKIIFSLATYLPDLKRDCPLLAGFQKLFLQLHEICHPVEAKDFNSLVLKNFQQIQKLWRLIANNFNIKLKAKF